jgi:hypothetical protein
LTSRIVFLLVLYCVIVPYCDVLSYCFEFLCYCIVCIVGDCDKFHIQQSLTDIGSMECVYVNVNVNGAVEVQLHTFLTMTRDGDG